MGRILLRILRVYVALNLLGLPCLVQQYGTAYAQMSSLVRTSVDPRPVTLWVDERGEAREASLRMEADDEVVNRMVTTLLLLDRSQDRLKLDRYEPSTGSPPAWVGVVSGCALVTLLLLLYIADPLLHLWRARWPWRLVCVLAALALATWLVFPSLRNITATRRMQSQVQEVVGSDKTRCWVCYRGKRRGVVVEVDGPVSPQLKESFQRRLGLQASDRLLVESWPGVRAPEQTFELVLSGTFLLVLAGGLLWLRRGTVLQAVHG